LKHGGEVRYRQDVDGIEVVDGKAVAVTTAKGLRVEADLIISNANPSDTMLRFIGPDHLPNEYARSVKEATDRPALGSLVVYLGLEKDLIAEGWPHHELFVATTYDLEEDYAAMREGRWEDVGLVISHYDHVDPTCSPEGSSVLSITTLAPWDYSDQWGTHGDLDDYSDNKRYVEIKEAAGQTLVDRVAELIPGLKDSIVHIEIGTPITNWRYSLNPSGSIYGSEQTVENMYMNRLSERTPITNVFLTGAWVFGGGMSAAMMSGRSVARRADNYFAGESAESLFTPDLEPHNDEPTDRADERRPSTPGPTTAVAPGSSHTLTAAVSGREIDFARPGLPTTLVFHDQDSAEAGVRAVVAIRSEHADAASVTVANVVDLQSVPKMFRRFANTSMRNSYAQAEERLSEGKRPEDYVVILPDWDGSATESFGFSDLGADIGVVVLDAEGEVVGVHQGESATDEALEDLRQVVD
jgi:prolycopene isomerase